jgi:hypothetical protein
VRPALARGGARLLLGMLVFIVGAPLIVAVLGLGDRFYARNLIVAVPLLGGLAAPGLLKVRALPLIVFLSLAVLTSVWVATDWRYEQVDWRAAVARAQAVDAGSPVITVGVDSSNVAAFYLRRQATRAPLVAAGAVLVIQPHRGSGERALMPNGVPPAVAAGLAGFTVSRTTIVRGFRVIELRGARPVRIVPASLLGATVFPARAGAKTSR